MTSISRSTARVLRQYARSSTQTSKSSSEFYRILQKTTVTATATALSSTFLHCSGIYSSCSESALVSQEEQQPLILHHQGSILSELAWYTRLTWRLLRLLWHLTPIAVLYPFFCLLPAEESSNNETNIQGIVLSSSKNETTSTKESLSSTLRSLYYRLALYCTENSGATVIKLCQWAGSRPDLFGADFCRVFSALQDDARPHSIQATEQVLEAEYGSDWKEWLQMGRLVGSGCIGQVHEGTIVKEYKGCTPQKVAIKILHPNAADDLLTDLELLRALAQFWDGVVPEAQKWIDWPSLVDEFARLLLTQLDLRNEARNLEAISNNFRGRATKTCVQFPEIVVPPGEQVLIESYMEGIPVLEYARRRMEQADVGGATQQELHNLCVTAITAVCEMIFTDNFMHGMCWMWMVL